MNRIAPLVAVKDLKVFFGNYQALNIPHFVLHASSKSIIIGANGSGKTLLLNFLSGKLKLHKQAPHYSENFDPETALAIVSFEYQQELYAIDDYNDDTDFMDGVRDKGTLAKEAILQEKEESERFFEIVELMNIRYLLERGIRFLSTGERRKVLIARALLNNPKLLVIDSPFEGLDLKSRTFLRERLIKIMANFNCLLLLNENDDIINHADRLIFLDKGEIVADDTPNNVKNSAAFKKLFDSPSEKFTIPPLLKDQEKFTVAPNVPLIEMKNVSVIYGDVTALNNLTWQMKADENWIISGPNGAGKSTLLSLITADNPQAYGKEFYLFGQKRGSGETIWDIKKRIGIVTSLLQLNYKQPLNALQVVVSGFFDSIGLYQKATPEQIDSAKKWLNILEIHEIDKRYFNELSYGEQRMVLLARAMVKHPLLLILDEPCQGLDSTNRKKILNLVDFIALNSPTRVIYVNHSQHEVLQCINRRLEFFKNDQGLYSFRTSSI